MRLSDALMDYAIWYSFGAADGEWPNDIEWQLALDKHWNEHGNKYMQAFRPHTGKISWSDNLRLSYAELSNEFGFLFACSLAVLFERELVLEDESWNEWENSKETA